MRNEENKKQANKFLNQDYHEDYQGDFIFKNNEQHS